VSVCVAAFPRELCLRLVRLGPGLFVAQGCAADVRTNVRQGAFSRRSSPRLQVSLGPARCPATHVERGARRSRRASCSCSRLTHPFILAPRLVRGLCAPLVPCAKRFASLVRRALCSPHARPGVAAWRPVQGLWRRGSWAFEGDEEGSGGENVGSQRRGSARDHQQRI
jgi:hypothetical protein